MKEIKIMNTVIFVIALLCFILWLICGRSRQVRKRVVAVNHEACVGCGCCVGVCRQDVLELVKSSECSKAMVKSPEKCRACGHCIASCQLDALRLVERL